VIDDLNKQLRAEESENTDLEREYESLQKRVELSDKEL